MKFHDKDYDRILSIISREGETIEVCVFYLTGLSVYVNVAVVIPVSPSAQRRAFRDAGFACSQIVLQLSEQII